MIARVFMPFRQFDWFYRAFLLVLSIFSFYLIERCDFFALFLRQLIEVFSSNPKKYLKNLCILHVFKQRRFLKKMRHLHQASLLCSGWFGLFCLFACWCNRDISVPHLLLLLIEQLHNQMVCPESLWRIFCRWRARLCVPPQHMCLKEHLQLFHPPALNGCPQSWYISYLWFSYRLVKTYDYKQVFSRLYWAKRISNSIFFYAASLHFQVSLLRLGSLNNQRHKLAYQRSTCLIFWYWWYQLDC